MQSFGASNILSSVVHPDSAVVRMRVPSTSTPRPCGRAVSSTSSIQPVAVRSKMCSPEGIRTAAVDALIATRQTVPLNSGIVSLASWLWKIHSPPALRL